ncbi:two-component regulator propeller domain-containing protein [Paraflavisolibacter sp. H34]|uniref:hybrid sensor histidine kinase/response regulator transcription factor n=1 Tax=Huijunlia imazamoxiresistens TaxID=3127457 RepID=UPI003018D9F6
MSKRLQLLLWSGWMLLALLGAGRAVAQVETRHFRTISVDQGLSQGTVYTILQDTLGFIWMGTQDGLNRYNGESFSVYRPSKNDPRSLSSYYIRSLLRDEAGTLWVGGNRGVSRYDYSANNFHNYAFTRKPGEWYISALVQDARRTLWAASSAGALFRLQAAADTFLQVPFGTAAYRPKTITCLQPWHNDLLVGTKEGLFRRTAAGTTEPIHLGIAPPWVNKLFPDGPWLWVTTEGDGLFRYDTRNGAVQQYRHGPGASSLADDAVRGINKDARSQLWLGTFRGLSVLDPASGKFSNYYHQPSLPYTLSQNSVRCIFRDQQDGMWLGTYYGGVNYYHPGDIVVNLLGQNTGELSLSDRVVNVIRQDSKGNFWIGTNDKGLNYWDTKARKIRYYTQEEGSGGGLSSNNIQAIAFSPSGQVLVGTHNTGLNVLDPATGRTRVYRYREDDPNSLSGDMVYALLTDSRNRIWIGTRSGLDQFHPSGPSFTRLFSDSAGRRLSSDEITYLLEDSRHRIWIGTTNGVNLFYPDRLRFDPLPGATLSNDVINCIAEDRQKRIWVGTRDGLNLYHEATRSFTGYGTQPAFPKGAIYGIQSDDEGNLWISTNTGLIRFNPETFEQQSFDNKDGLQNSSFNLYAFCKAADGLLLFGGTNGVSYFYPSALRQPPVSLKLTFTGLEALNKAVTPGDETAILDRHIDQAGRLTLSHEYRQFSIYFNAFNYISADRTRYRYQLEGFDHDWQTAEVVPRATYTNLPPGNYTFRVKAVGPQGESSPTRSLRIRVLPPWYRSFWFYLLVVGVAAAAGIFLYHILSEQMRTRQQLKGERLEREKMDDINRMKTEFFTNVSHELRTPLTLIMAPLEILLAQPSTDRSLRKRLEPMLANVKRLSQLVNQLFEFKKTERGTRRLQVARGELVGLLQEIHASFRPLSEKNDIRFSYHPPEDLLCGYFDKEAVEHILFNLLSNAFKYTPGGGSIAVDLSATNGQAVIRVTDTGKGMAREHLDKIFDRYYQVSGPEMNLGSGVGLAFTRRLVELHHGTITVDSQPGRGSTFTVTLPLSADAYAGDDLVDILVSDAPAPAPAVQEAEEAPTRVPEAAGEGPNGLQEGEKLLLVDDNREILEYLKEYFGKSYQVRAANDGKEALALLEDYQPDLVISDVMMPEMDGLQFCKRVKQNIRTSHIPVILLTAKTETPQQVKGLEMGADDYVTKPFSIAVLQARVQNILRSRRQLREYYAQSTEVAPEKITFNALDEEFLKNAIAIVEANIQEYDFSVDKFSREVGMSRSNLYLKIKAITGESATAFIKRIRFKKAVELLESRQYTMAEVAYMSGFNSPSYFSTAFKQFYGCMPTEYLSRKAPRQENEP